MRATAAGAARFLIRHLGNMGDMIFFIPPVLDSLKRHWPHCHLTFVTAWGFKERRLRFGPRLGWRWSDHWGNRNQGGFSLALLATNPHIDQLVHWHDTALSLAGRLCVMEGKSYPTWNRAYYEQQKSSGRYTQVFELDFGLSYEDNPLKRMYAAVGLPHENYSHSRLYVTEADRAVAAAVTSTWPRPRIILLEGLASQTTRGWDPDKVTALQAAIRQRYHIEPRWFGGDHVPWYRGRPLTLRENIATLAHADVAIGVMSGPVHFAAASGLPTLTLFGDQPLHRAAPAYFLNRYISDPHRRHRTLIGPTHRPYHFLKHDEPALSLTPAERVRQRALTWQRPGRQATKSCISVITVDEVMAVLSDRLTPP